MVSVSVWQRRRLRTGYSPATRRAGCGHLGGLSCFDAEGYRICRPDVLGVNVLVRSSLTQINVYRRGVAERCMFLQRFVRHGGRFSWRPDVLGVGASAFAQ